MSRITFSSGETVDVEGDLEAVMEELHRVATRREHSFAVLRTRAGGTIGIRPDAVMHVRTVGAEGDGGR
jgi:hypothetical protein